MARPHPWVCEEGGWLAPGDVPVAHEPLLGLGRCRGVTSSRRDLAHGNTSAQVTPCDLLWGSPGGAKAEACRRGGMSRGVFLGGLRTMLFRKCLAVWWH